ncbi:MAG: TetR/AcrR family transcriptional regulator [Bilophila sp.]
MSKPQVRKYCSPLRERKANLTRSNIADAAERLLISSGYAGMTVEAIAKEAGVSTQTVYAVFGSKRGIMAELLDRVIYIDHFHELHERSINSKDTQEALRYTVSLIRQVYESESAVYALLRGAGVLDPELARIESDREALRRELQEHHVECLLTGKQLKAGLTMASAQDIFWCLTSRDVYRMMVQERGWTSTAYENWMLALLAGALLEGTV